MTYSGREPPKDRRWLTIVLAAWLSALAVGFGVAYFVWTALAPAAPGGRLSAEGAAAVSLGSAPRQ